ncbi:S41 family peptidase [Olivibacter sp. XZL3]|uniref:S41 family peptidase n=1 Tax=Olivibacter sp. XZL3 TaxID=1735116 RepID=UPI001F113B57|nr:S41 family peptidase [Olivibacter sp. XZL3]
MLFISCQKEEPAPGDEILSPLTGTRMEFTLDSIFLYAKQVYLWNDALPSYDEFAPRTRYGAIDPEIAAYRTELYDISQMNRNPNTGDSYELPVYAGSPKYSYLEQRTTSGRTAKMTAISGMSSDLIVYKLIEDDDKKIGYIYLASFPSLGVIKEQLDAIFNSFAKAEVTDVVVDLRSNRGGYVETAAYLANLIVSSDLTGKVMYSEQFNSLMQAGGATLLKNQLYRDANGNTVLYGNRLATMADIDFSKKANTVLFKKEGSLETVKEIYFITSGNTASASELLISSTKPYVSVKLIGEKTYGKPVGFFGIHIDAYTIYLSSFTIQNAVGWYDYYDGMPPDVNVVLSGQASLGDPEEKGLHTALNLIKGESVLLNSSNRKTSLSARKIAVQERVTPKIQNVSANDYIPICKQDFKLK